jgi:hypothetical protein
LSIDCQVHRGPRYLCLLAKERTPMLGHAGEEIAPRSPDICRC